jgi:hypothetical protein
VDSPRHDLIYVKAEHPRVSTYEVWARCSCGEATYHSLSHVKYSYCHGRIRNLHKLHVEAEVSKLSSVGA